MHCFFLCYQGRMFFVDERLVMARFLHFSI